MERFLYSIIRKCSFESSERRRDLPMISRRHALGFIAGSGLVSLSGFARAAEQGAPPLSDDGLHIQPWFMETFLDLGDDHREAAQAGKRFAVIWEQKGCPYCAELHRKNFSRPAVRDYIKGNFGVVQLNLWGSREVTDFNGDAMEERELARRWRVNFTPTIQFFDKSLDDKPGKGGIDREVARIPGYFKPFHFLTMFQFVREDAYASKNFQRYLQDKLAALKAKGIDPAVW